MFQIPLRCIRKPRDKGVTTLMAEQSATTRQLAAIAGGEVYPQSLNAVGEHTLFLVRRPEGRRLAVLGRSGDPLGLNVVLERCLWQNEAHWLGLGPLDHANACRLRQLLPFTAPSLVGVHKSAGLGDRLGLATPGHIRAMRHVQGIVPVYAQQSIREMERTGRTPEQVLDDATFGVLQEGWRAPHGADADHLKTTEDIDRCVAAGYIMYTFDPRDQVDNDAESDALPVLRDKYAALPWGELGVTAGELYRRYVGNSWALSGRRVIALDELGFLRAACKYGAALAHIRDLYEHLRRVRAGAPWEVEVSVDETDTPTRPAEHWFIARELQRLGVDWVSLAPRYVGRFEKGVDYIGDLGTFEKDWAWHVAIARALGPYKLSLHSGSDKFSIYPIAARHAGDLVHLKTAGTSYLEALRVVAQSEPALFREILALSAERYEYERRSYHVSAELKRVPDPASVPDSDLPSLLSDFDARQVLHVAFGVVLSGDQGHPSLFSERIFSLLNAHEEAHYRGLEVHFMRHIQPFA